MKHLCFSVLHISRIYLEHSPGSAFKKVRRQVWGVGQGGGDGRVPRTQFVQRSRLLPISNVPFQRHSYPQINKTTSIFVRFLGLHILRAGWSVLLGEGAVKRVKVRGQPLGCVFPRLPSTLVLGCFVLFGGVSLTGPGTHRLG